jgi:hypothetical protein
MDNLVFQDGSGGFGTAAGRAAPFLQNEEKESKSKGKDLGER